MLALKESNLDLSLCSSFTNFVKLLVLLLSKPCFKEGHSTIPDLMSCHASLADGIICLLLDYFSLSLSV